MSRQRTQFRSTDFGAAPGLQRPLNDLALDVQTRLEALETSQSAIDVLPDVDITVGASLAAGTAPFPLLIGAPDKTAPRGLVLINVQNLTSSGTVATSAHFPQWRTTSVAGGVGLEVLLVTGLSTNTSYRLTFGVIR